MVLLRETLENDIEDIYKYIHEPYVKKYCKDADKQWENHRNWYKFLINSNSYLMYTVLDCETEEFLGYVKFEVEQEVAIINIYLIPDLRRRGYGENIIKLSIEELKSYYPEVSIVLAYILEENLPSLKAFKSLGFMFDGNDTYNGMDHKLFIKFV